MGSYTGKVPSGSVVKLWNALKKAGIGFTMYLGSETTTFYNSYKLGRTRKIGRLTKYNNIWRAESGDTEYRMNDVYIEFTE